MFVGLNLNVHNMAKTYKGTLSLDWYNKQQSILLREKDDISLSTDVPAPKINWVNKDEALFYEIDSEGGIGQTPYWVERNDIRVKEARPLILQKVFKAVAESKPGTLQGMDTTWKVVESKEDDPAVENILIKGDNLLALNTLKKMFSNKPNEEKVKCIFIDPPYNTGKAFENYDDNLEFSEWLTLFRDRATVLREILSDSGFMFCILDDNAVFHCKVLMDEIFGRENFLGDIVWQSRKSVSNDTFISLNTNHILCYTKNKELCDKSNFRLAADSEKFSNPDNDPRGKWVADPFDAPEERDNLNYPIENPNTGEIYYPPKGRHWRTEKDKYISLLNDNRIVFGKKGVSKPQLKRFWTEAKAKGLAPTTLWFTELPEQNSSSILWSELPSNTEATKNLEKLFGEKVFNNPKPEQLLYRVLELATNEGDIVLDSFGGSGTTFAVAHKMGRRWVGLEIGEQADEVIVPRLKMVLSGKDTFGVSSEALWTGGGSFKYYHLGQSIITINEDGTGDFNWSLGKKFIEESFLSSYDYTLDKTINLSEGQLFRNEENAPSIGVQAFGTKKRVAVITLNQPGGKNDTLTYDEIFHIYSTIKKNLNPEYINIFTNKGLELAYDSKPEDLDVIKVPHAIFSELEK